MAFQIPVKYFNSFWLKKVIGDARDPESYIVAAGATYDFESRVTCEVEYGSKVGNPTYLIPTWPGLPWGSQLTKIVP